MPGAVSLRSARAVCRLPVRSAVCPLRSAVCRLQFAAVCGLMRLVAWTRLRTNAVSNQIGVVA